MKLNRTTALKSLLLITSMLLLALILKPAAALAEEYTVTFVIPEEQGYFAWSWSGESLGNKIEVTTHDGQVFYSDIPTLYPKGEYANTLGWYGSGKLNGYQLYIESVSADLTCGNSSIPMSLSAGDLSWLKRKNNPWPTWYTFTQDTTITYRYYPMARIMFETDETVTRVLANGVHTADLVAGEESISSPSSGLSYGPMCIDGYKFDYWTTDVEVSTDTATFEPGDHISLADAKKIIPTQGFILTAHTRQTSATATFTTDGHGTNGGNGSRTIKLDNSYEIYDKNLWVGGPVGSVYQPKPSEGYEFAYWTTDEDVYSLSDDKLTAIPEGTHLTGAEVASCYISRDTTFEANFVRVTPYTVSYETDGNGSVATKSEDIQNAFDSPKGTKVTPNKGYEFDYWTASIDVQIPGEDGSANPITIAQGEKITDEQLKKVLVTDDITFTAHFKQTSVDPEPEPKPVDPDNPDGGDTIKPADGTTGKLTPKTGDALPGATAAVALGAGVVVAGATLLRKRHQ